MLQAAFFNEIGAEPTSPLPFAPKLHSRKRSGRFADWQHLLDADYVSTVIAAQNNLAGEYNASFAPGEGAAIVFGIDVRLGR